MMIQLLVWLIGLFVMTYSMNKKLEAKSKDAAMLNAMINVNNPNYRIQYVQNPINQTNIEQKIYDACI